MMCGFMLCSSTFKNTDRYEKHVADFHEEKVSNVRFSNETGLLSSQEEKSELHCPSCDYVASSKSSMRGHKFWKHPNSERGLECGSDSQSRAPLLDTHALSSLPVSETCGTSNNEHCSEGDEPVFVEEEASVETSTMDLEIRKNLLEKKSLQLFLTLNSKYHIPESTLDYIVGSYRFLLEESMNLTKSSLLKKLEDMGNVSPAIKELVSSELSESYASQLHGTSGPLRSSYIREKAYKKHFAFVNPRPHYLGVNNFDLGKKCHFVSIAETLQNLFKDDSFYQQYNERLTKEFKNTDILEDIQSGVAFQNNSFFKENPDAIQIILHQDDADMANGMGSACGIYKTTFYNYTLGNIHPWNRSQTSSKLLALACVEKDVGFYGLEEVLRPLISELQHLETFGLEVRDHVIKVGVMVLLGDNLGTHTVAGYVENFSTSNYFCRYCEESRQEWRERWSLSFNEENNFSSEESSEESDSEDDSDEDVPLANLRARMEDKSSDSSSSSDEDVPLADLRRTLMQDNASGGNGPDIGRVRNRHVPVRTKESYDACVAALALNPSGVKGVVAESQFNKLNFHVVGSTPPCLPHDIFLGFLPYDLVLALKQLSATYKFKIEHLSRLVKKFPFKDGDFLDKPSPKFSRNMKKTSGHAVQNWVLVRFLPLLIGDKVTVKSDPAWKMILVLIEALQLLCSPVISKSSLDYIENLILTYLHLRTSLFSVPTRPKHHYFEHYPWLTKVYGPLMRCSTLGFERKNKFYRETVRAKRNLKNPTKLIAKEHQRMQAALMGDVLFKKGPAVEKPILFENLSVPDSVHKCILDTFGLELAVSLVFSKEAMFRNTVYKSERVVVLSTERYPEIDVCKIELLVCHGNQLHLIGTKCCASLDPEMQIFFVKESDDVTIQSVENLKDYVPYPMYRYYLRNCIVLKHLFRRF